MNDEMKAKLGLTDEALEKAKEDMPFVEQCEAYLEGVEAETVKLNAEMISKVFAEIHKAPNGTFAALQAAQLVGNLFISTYLNLATQSCPAAAACFHSYFCRIAMTGMRFVDAGEGADKLLHGLVTKDGKFNFGNETKH